MRAVVAEELEVQRIAVAEPRGERQFHIDPGGAAERCTVTDARRTATAVDCDVDLLRRMFDVEGPAEIVRAHLHAHLSAERAAHHGAEGESVAHGEGHQRVADAVVLRVDAQGLLHEAGGPDAGVGGLIHCMLPLSRIDPDKARNNPHMFTDTGVPALIQALLDRGGSRKRLVAKVAGGASPLNDNGMFKIGERNYTVLRKVLWKNEILIAAEEVGGTIARTMILNVGNGRTFIRTGGKEREL